MNCAQVSQDLALFALFDDVDTDHSGHLTRTECVRLPSSDPHHKGGLVAAVAISGSEN